MERFKNVLEKNENVVAEFVPNKTKFMFSSFVWTFLCFDLVLLFGTMWMFIEGMILYGFVTIAIMIAVLVVVMVWCGMFHSTCSYAITNKKIIIRSGIFGVDFKTMDIKLVGAVNVEVTLIDKIVGKNTGTIYFYEHGNTNVIHKFAHIEDPYEAYRQIKELIG